MRKMSHLGNRQLAFVVEREVYQKLQTVNLHHLPEFRSLRRGRMNLREELQKITLRKTERQVTRDV